MTKADLIKKIATAANINATEAKQALDAATESIKQALAAGEKIKLKIMGYEPETYFSAGSATLNTAIGDVAQ